MRQPILASFNGKLPFRIHQPITNEIGILQIEDK